MSFECDTKVGPFRFTDRMETTEWIDRDLMGIRHIGLIAGEGRFTLEAEGVEGTRFTWEETLHFPWWMGGPIGALVGAPVLRFVWRRNLENLAARFRH